MVSSVKKYWKLFCNELLNQLDNWFGNPYVIASKKNRDIPYDPYKASLELDKICSPSIESTLKRYREICEAT